MVDRFQFERLALSSLTEDDCPDPDILAAHIVGTLTGNEQLSVAAHIRTCALCQADVAVCRPPEPRAHRWIAQLTPVFAGGQQRTTAIATHVRQYVAADLRVELTIAPPTGDFWRLTGQVLRAGDAQAGCAILLRSRSGRRREQVSDAQGFFTFADLPAGRYTLTVTREQIQIQIRGLVFEHGAV